MTEAHPTRTRKDPRTMSDLPTNPHDHGTEAALSTLVERLNKLTSRDMDARLVAGLKARGEYDPERHRVLDEPPLTEAEHIAVLAYGEAIARSARHPSFVHHAVRAGVPWGKIAEALGQYEPNVRRDYVLWANGQRRLAVETGAEGGVVIGMTEAEHAEAVARAGGIIVAAPWGGTTPLSATAELSAEDLAPGSAFNVEVLGDDDTEPSLYVQVFYDTKDRRMYDGEGTGATFTEAAGRAIADAEGEEEEDSQTPPEDSMLHPGAVERYAETLGDRFQTGDLQ